MMLSCENSVALSPKVVVAPNVHLFRLVKMGDMVYIGLLFFLVAGTTTFALNMALPPVHDERHPMLLLLEIMALALLLPIVAYISRLVVKRIPSPFHGVLGFDHMRMKELTGGVIIAFTMMLFFPRMAERVSLLHNYVKKLRQK